MAVKVKAEKKIVRGYNLSAENIMALKAAAFEQTLKEPRTVSASEVLDEILTAWRKGRERGEKMQRTLKEVKA